jgi:hypothetical protein
MFDVMALNPLFSFEALFLLEDHVDGYDSWSGLPASYTG